MLERRTPLQRKGALVRKTPIKARSQLKPGKPLQRTQFVRRAPKDPIPASARKAVKERSGGFCELQVPGACIGVASDIDHIKNRVHCAKDEKHDLSNLNHACRPCHDWKGANPNAAEERGIYRRNGA